jgi:hypothetical protein
MRYWLGDEGLDRHVCLAVHNLKQADVTPIANTARGMLVSNRHVNPKIQFLPDDAHVAESLQRLVERGFILEVADMPGIFAPAKAIYQGWP